MDHIDFGNEFKNEMREIQNALEVVTILGFAGTALLEAGSTVAFASTPYTGHSAYTTLLSARKYIVFAASGRTTDPEVIRKAP